MDHVGSGNKPQIKDMMSIAFLSRPGGDVGPVPRDGSSSAQATNSAHSASASRSIGSSRSQQSFSARIKTQASHNAAVKDEDDGEDAKESISPISHGAWRGDVVTDRSPRSPRPSYTEEQKFFIMWARIVQEKGWIDIENEFANIWGQRTKGGLTSVYYRIRKSWGLEEVLKSDARSSDADRKAVALKANHVSPMFLGEIGYVER